MDCVDVLERTTYHIHVPSVRSLQIWPFGYWMGPTVSEWMLQKLCLNAYVYECFIQYYIIRLWQQHNKMYYSHVVYRRMKISAGCAHAASHTRELHCMCLSGRAYAFCLLRCSFSSHRCPCWLAGLLAGVCKQITQLGSCNFDIYPWFFFFFRRLTIFSSQSIY